MPQPLLSGSNKVVCQFCFRENISTTAHLPDAQNNLVDHLSRNFCQNHEWSLKSSRLRSMFREWGIPTVDLFATKNKFCSQLGLSPGSLINAFHVNWGSVLMYTFPRSPLFPQFENNLMLDRAKLILVASDFIIARQCSEIFSVCV